MNLTEARQEILKAFCGDDDIRPWMNEPWTWDGKTGATNGHILIVFSGEDEGVKKSELANIGVVFPKTLWKTPVQIHAADLRSMLAGLPLEDEVDHIDCDDCQGTGWETCGGPFPECGGFGISAQPSGKKVLPLLTYVKIKDILFSARYIEKLLFAMDTIEADSVSMVSGPKKGYGRDVLSCVPMFEIGDVQIIIMPVAENSGMAASATLTPSRGE